ncbi:MAG: MiaB/RimO family radical SAM methylthiotransferase [Vicinamibacterales bacterium]
MKYAVVTFGCRVNQADSLAIESQLLDAGGEPVPADHADLVIVNTCSVTASADQGARQTIRRVARTNPAATIVVTGCYATREPEQVAALPNVARVVGNAEKDRLLLLDRAIDARELASGDALTLTTAERFGAGDGSCGAALEPGAAGRTSFTLRVQTGCAEPCSYCIIPSTRGAPSSRPIARVLADVRRAAGAGFKEITLTGVHLGSYGRDLPRPTTLDALMVALRDLAIELAGSGQQVMFRVSSLEPMDCSADVVALVRESTCFAPSFHLPLQHGSPRMLTAMRRPYDLAYYARVVDSIRNGIPNASIGSDLIVGFPGETDDDFEQLATYVEGSPLTQVHVFPYSDRPGTEASAMRGRPSGEVVKARGARLRAIGAALNRRFVESQVGTVHRALTLEGGTVALTGNYLKVRIPPGLPRNVWVDLRVTGAAPVPSGEVLRSV